MSFAAPALVLVLVFYLTPVILGFALSLTNWSVYHETTTFLGLDNYEDMLRQGTLGNTVQVTLKFAVIFTLAANVLALVFALLLERPTRANMVFRTALFIPVLISPLAVGYLFRGILARDGAFNEGLSAILPFNVEVAWLGDTTWTIAVLALVSVWKAFGLYMLVYIAALSSVPDDLVQAAKIDGAGTIQVIRRIKLPLIAQGFTFNLALALIGGLQTFELVLTMTDGGPGSSTTVLNYLIWRFYGAGNLGYAAAINVLLFVIIALLALPLITLLRRREVDL